MARAIVVCPLEFERRLLVRAGIGRVCTLACCGPGADRVGQWAAEQSPSGAVILCGVAGALSGKFTVGSACAVAAVVGDDGHRLEPTLSAPGGAVVSCPTGTLTTAASKRAWADRTGADIVDMESAAFARVAVRRGWAWGVVRGVSDAPDDTLPRDIDTWVDQRGRPRLGRVLRALLLGHAGVGQLARLRADGTAAMSAAAAVLARMLER